MPRSLSKLLFPKAAPDQRQRKMQVLRFVLVAGVLLAVAVGLLLYALYLKERP